MLPTVADTTRAAMVPTKGVRREPSLHFRINPIATILRRRTIRKAIKRSIESRRICTSTAIWREYKMMKVLVAWAQVGDLGPSLPVAANNLLLRHPLPTRSMVKTKFYICRISRSKRNQTRNAVSHARSIVAAWISSRIWTITAQATSSTFRLVMLT